MTKRFFKPCLKKAGIRDIRFHDLRHTYASLMIAKGLPIKFIQQQMGHSSIQVTLDKYGHLMPELYEVGANAMNDVVIKCYNGMASGACVALDIMFGDKMLGSLAGDDTVL